ncbi:TPA: ABC transporter ATP-binding protein [Aeromonas veronii]
MKQFIFPKIQRIVGIKSKEYFREYWALRDVSFTVKKGETIGIVGRNGSGKSTILQMICGTLNPTAGTIKTKGRIAALLELGSGFNPEFTGRENVYLNGVVLGLTKPEIDERLDSIMAFADIGDFIDQPVKTYSSGMMLRLAFAVIAHVDADILIVDEALAVGDAVFTQKCMRFIRKFKENGTLLFVSHDMGSVLNLCENAIWLHQGNLLQKGTAKDISDAYLKSTLQTIYADEAKLIDIIAKKANELDSSINKENVNDENIIDYGAQYRVSSNLNNANGWKSGAGEIISVAFSSPSSGGSCGSSLLGGETVEVTIKAIAYQDMDRPILGFLVRDKLGQDLFGENTLPFTNLHPTPIHSGNIFEGRFRFTLPMLPNGEYSVMTSLADGDLINHVQHHWLHDALIIKVASSQVRWGLVGIQFQEIFLDVEK